MSQQKVAAETVVVVVRGFFNPPIFSPRWFLDQELIGATEFGDSEIEVITRDVARFRMGWLNFHADSEGIELSSTEPDEFERLRDATVGILMTLKETPISALGINRNSHLPIETIERFHQIGDALIPKEEWQSTLHLAGTRSATLWGARQDGYSGNIHVQVEPSLVVQQAVFVGCNDHFALGLAKTPQDRSKVWDLSDDTIEPTSAKIPMAVRILTDEWSPSLSRSELYIKTVLNLANQGGS